MKTKSTDTLRRMLLTSFLSVALFLVVMGSTPIHTEAQFVTNTPTAFLRAQNGQPIPIPERPLSEGQALQIIAATLENTPNTLDRVSLTVQNVTEEAQRGAAWYLLAPPSVPDPWNQAVYTAPDETFELAPGESVVLEFGSPDSFLQGEYSMSLWVHQFDGDERTHADGLVYETPLVIGPPLFLTVDYVDILPQEDGETLVFVTFTFHNTTDTLVDAGYSYSIGAPDDPTPWQTGVYNLPFRAVLLPANSRQTLTTRSVVDLPNGEFQVVGWLHERVNDELEFRNNAPTQP